MSLLLDTWTAGVTTGLARSAAAVKQTAPRRWTFAMPNAGALVIDAQLTEEWLQLDAPLASLEAEARLGFGVLAANATMPAGWRLCAAARESQLRLRADVPLLEEIAPAQRVERLCQGLAVVEAWLANGAADGPLDVGVPQALDRTYDLECACRETGWPFTARDSDTVMVELNVPGAFQQAAFERRRRGMVISAPVLEQASPSPICAAAATRFLLALTGAVRMVSAVSEDGRVDFRVCFDCPPAGPELAHALAALSVAWRCGGREASVLARDERIARLYGEAFADTFIDEELNGQPCEL
jgi:hypothetical protein